MNLSSIATVLTAFGLSTASGLNAWLPVLCVGLVARYTSFLHLVPPFDVLANPWVLGGVGLVALADFIGDKVPMVDHVLHTAGTVIHPVAGAVVALAAASPDSHVHPLLLGVAGLVVAGTLHGARAMLRPVVNATTAGVGAPVVSLAEDVAAVGLSITALLLPALAALAALGVAALLYWRWRYRDRAT